MHSPAHSLVSPHAPVEVDNTPEMHFTGAPVVSPHAPEEVDNTPEMHSSAHSVVSPHAPEGVDNTFSEPMCNGNVGSANVYLTTAGLARSSCAVQGNPQTSHDDEANLPLSQDEVDLPDGVSVKLDFKAQRAKPIKGAWKTRNALDPRTEFGGV